MTAAAHAASELLLQGRTALARNAFAEAGPRLARAASDAAAGTVFGTANHYLGKALRRLDQPAAALRALQQAAKAGNGTADTFNEMALALDQLGAGKAATDAWRLAIQLSPHTAGLYLNLGNAQLAQGDRAGAATTFATAQSACPGDPVIAHMHIATVGGPAPARADDAYVAATFDDFAATFDARLAQLDYRAPALCQAALRAAGLEPNARLDVLDAGCGTGLCAPLLKPYAARLEGVDLSAAMLARARARGYDALHQGEIGAFLRDRPRAWDVIVAADVFSYFGALDDVLADAARALRHRGVLVATVERGADGAGIHLGPEGRYSHDEAHVRAAAAQAGLALRDLTTATLRRQHGQAVAGLVFTLSKDLAEGATS